MRMMTGVILVAACLGVGACAGSAGISSSNTEAKIAAKRDVELARKHVAAGMEMLKLGRDAAAEQAFKMAIEADGFSGVAHNNLGRLYFQRGELYQAAWQFDYAAKLMPNKAQPRNNLGMVLEAAGRLDEAIEQYNQSLGLDPDNAEVLGNLTRAHVRHGHKGQEVRELLNDMVLKEHRPVWVNWAKRQLALSGENP